MSTDPMRRAWVGIDPSALRENLATVQRAAGPEVGVLPMVKADAYGVGVEGVVRALEPSDPWGYGVATVTEGIALRGMGVKRPILVLAPAPPRAEAAGLAAGLTLAISSIDALDRVLAAAESLGLDGSVHVDVDTGMGRSGFDAREVGTWGPELIRRSGGRVRWEGTFTHFHSADEGAGEGVPEQVERFRGAIGALRELGYGGELLHLGNSAATLRFGALGGALVRPGIFLYGGAVGEGLARPAEVVTVRARVTHLREVPPGTTLGYGATWRARRRERWATLGIGYGDGLPRVLGNRGEVLIRGRRAPIIGRISMDLTVVDITDLPPVGVGDVATLVGHDDADRITLEEVAGTAGTISYEILTGLTTRLPRVWLGDEGAGGEG